MSEWIDVKQKLPPVGQGNRILAFVIDYENDYTFQSVTNMWDSGFFSNVMRGQKVTHWMPLPAAPEVENV